LQIGLALEDFGEHIIIASIEACFIGSYLKGLSGNSDQIINGVMDNQIINKAIGAMLVEFIEKQCEPNQQPLAHHPLDGCLLWLSCG
jgi:hypothetical protein